MLLLKIGPNWASRVTERLGFNTTVFTTHNNREVRQAVRSRPRWQFEYEAMLLPENIRRLTNVMTRSKTEEVVIPVPHCFSFVRQPKTSISDFINCEKFWWMQVGVMVTVRNTLFEIIGVNTPNGIRVRPLAHGVSDDYMESDNITNEAGDANLVTESGVYNLVTENAISEYLFPGDTIKMAIRGRLEGKIDMRLMTSKVATAKIVFTASHDLGFSYNHYQNFQTFDGLDVMDWVPNWRDGMTFSLDTFREEFDSASGPVAFFWPSVYTSRAYSGNYLMQNANAAHRFMSFFCKQFGRARTIWFENPTREMEVARYRPGNVFIHLVDDEAVADMSRDSTIRYIMLRLADGNKIMRRIIGGTRERGLKTLRIRAAFEWPALTAPIVSCTFLFQGRFSNDELELVWHSSDVAECDFAVRTVDYLAGEPFNIVNEDETHNIVNEDGTRNITTETQ